MNENHTITLQDKKWGMPVRVLTLITFFLGAFTLVQAILLLSEYYSNYDVSMPVVILIFADYAICFCGGTDVCFWCAQNCAGKWSR